MIWEKIGSYLCLSDANPEMEDGDFIIFVYSLIIPYIILIRWSYTEEMCDM